MPELLICALIGAGIVGLILVLLSFFTVDQQSSAIIERFGRFVGVAQPGLNMKIPVVDQIAGRMNLRVQQLDVEVETKR